MTHVGHHLQIHAETYERIDTPKVVMSDELSSAELHFI
jgi:hypothetical protein